MSKLRFLWGAEVTHWREPGGGGGSGWEGGGGGGKSYVKRSGMLIFSPRTVNHGFFLSLN